MKHKRTYNLCEKVINKIKSKSKDHGDKSKYLELLVTLDDSKDLQELENKLKDKK